MAIRKPALSVSEAKRLATGRTEETELGKNAPTALAEPAEPGTSARPIPVLAQVSMPDVSAAPSPSYDPALSAGPESIAASTSRQSTSGPISQVFDEAAAPDAQAFSAAVVPAPVLASSPVQHVPDIAPVRSAASTRRRVPPEPSRPSVMPPPAARQKGIVLSAFTDARIQVFVSAFLPASGVSPSFDKLSAQYPAHKALQMILRRALDDFEISLESGSFTKLPSEYRNDGRHVIQTSRIMPLELVEVARAHFDPLGFESARAFGLKLATAALAAFFMREKKM